MPKGPQGRSENSVSADVDRLLGPKTSEELDVLQTQISTKLRSDEPIDVEYWEHLLSSIAVYKAKAELNKVYKSIIESRLNDLRQEQKTEAAFGKEKLASLLAAYPTGDTSTDSCGEARPMPAPAPLVLYSRQLDPEPHLKLRPEDKVYDVVEETDFINKAVSISSILYRMLGFLISVC